MTRIAALYVETGGVYFNLPHVEAWDVEADARRYTGPWPVVAHPPCQRWGKFWHGSSRKPHVFNMGEDMGTFACALTSVRNHGGVLEHPRDSHAWDWFGLARPPRRQGWVVADSFGGWACCIDQGHYGHEARKPTWLYAAHVERPELNWTECEQRIPAWMIERYGYEKARRRGVVSQIGGGDKTEKRNRTPLPFRDLLISIAQTARPPRRIAA